MRYFLLLMLAFCISCNDDGEFSLPPAPYDLVVQRLSSTEASLTWKDSTTVGGNYKLYRAVNTTQFEVLASVPQGTLTYKDVTITEEATYSYYLTLVDEKGNTSEYSSVEAVTALQSSQMSGFTVPDKKVGDSPFSIAGPTTLNPSPITYSSSNTAVATVGGNIIIVVGAGTTVITASQPMSFGYAAATSSANFTVHP